MSLPAALRALLLVLLGLALLLPFGAGEPGLEEVRWLGGEPQALERLLLARQPPRLLVRAAPTPPAVGELELLAGLARRSTLVVALPDGLPSLRQVRSPAGLRAGRAGALEFAVRGEPGDTILLRLLESRTPVDSVRVGVGAVGEGHGAFRVRPSRAGWHQWTVEAGGASATVGSWVAEERRLRVLVAAGPPTWETRFVSRALEEAGVEVTVSQPLGRGVMIGGGFPGSMEALRGFDAVILFGGVPIDARRRELLERYVAEEGGGALVAGLDAALPVLALADGDRPAGMSAAREITWSLPAELTALPAAPVESAAEVLTGTRPGVVAVAARSGGGSLLAVRALGRGRVAALGIRESWRWRLEAGRIDEHREFWRGLADWLASGLRDPITLRLGITQGPTRLPVEVRVHGAPGSEPRLTLSRPGGRSEPLTLGSAGPDPAAWRATFLPVDTGVHTLAVVGEPAVRAAFRATPGTGGGETAADAWARLALLAERSGGAALPRETVRSWVADRTRASGGARYPWLRVALFTLAVAVALSEWSLRRTRGLP